MKFLGFLLAVPLLICLIFSSNIYGYFRFKHYCSTEGGLRVYGKFERNAGWLAKDYWRAGIAAAMNGVAFVRYADERDGKLYDLRYVGGQIGVASSYIKSNADESMSIKYKWNSVQEEITTETRLSRSGYEILDMNNKVLARYYYFNYSKFDRANTLLDIPSYETCLDERGASNDGISQALKNIYTIFDKQIKD